MIGKGFVSKVEYEKHLAGDWRTVHNLWRHIRNYMVTYASELGDAYTKIQMDAGQMDTRYYTEAELNAGQMDTRYYTETETDAFFEGYSGGKGQVDAGNVIGLTQGSIPIADASGFLTEDNAKLSWDDTTGLNVDGNISIRNSKELRFYDNGNYVGFEAPALAADQIWVLPAADGDLDDALVTDGAGNLTWAPGGNGAVTFPALTDTPANYEGAGNKIVKVNATPNALEFGADISDLENVDSIIDQAGKYAKVKAGDAGIEWAAGTGNGAAAGPVLIFDSGFNDLALGNINGKGAYDFWGTWVNASGADCTAEIVADPGNGRMLRLSDQSVVNECHVSLTLTPNLSAEVLIGIVEWKIKVSALAANSRGYFNIQDKDIGATEQGGYFKGDTSDLNYRSASNQVGKLTDAVVDTWYIVRNLFDRLGNYCVWWLDGAFEQSRIIVNAGNKFDKLVLSTRDIYSGNVFDIKYVKVWSLNHV